MGSLPSDLPEPSREQPESKCAGCPGCGPASTTEPEPEPGLARSVLAPAGLFLVPVLLAILGAAVGSATAIGELLGGLLGLALGMAASAIGTILISLARRDR